VTLPEGSPWCTAGTGVGKKARLHRMLFRHGVGNGTALFLPYDHGLEHGPRDFFRNPLSADPGYIIKLAVDGGFNGVVLHIGHARRFYWDYAGEIPLVLKLNGKTEFPPDDEPVSPLNATVADAVALGADAVGYTLYVGSPRQADDFDQFRTVRQDADRYGLPVIVWAYPRGSAVNRKGGRSSFYTIDYAARVAAELGADMVKLTWPESGAHDGIRPEYDREFTVTQRLASLVRSAGRTMVLLAGGDKADPGAVLDGARAAMAAGATGLMVGRNVWQRERTESLLFVARLREALSHPVAADTSGDDDQIDARSHT
jgi:fructose-bisphosphate aldolase, class I